MGAVKAIMRALAAGLVAVVLVAVAIGLPVLLSVEHSALGLWPVFLLIFGAIWMAIRGRKAAQWVSPLAFLIVSVPLLIILLGVYMILPTWSSDRPSFPGGPRPGRTLSWIPADQRQSFDLSARLVTMDGEEVTLADLQDKVLFLNIWATWCGPCRAEMPSMANLYEQLGKEGLSMVAVTDEDAASVRQYLDNRPYPFTILRDPNQDLMRTLDITSIPTTFIIDQEQKVALYHVGSMEWDTDSIVDLFSELLGP